MFPDVIPAFRRRSRRAISAEKTSGVGMDATLGAALFQLQFHSRHPILAHDVLSDAFTFAINATPSFVSTKRCHLAAADLFLSNSIRP